MSVRDPVTEERFWQLRRAVLRLILVAQRNGLNDDPDVNEAKELIRCRVQQCGMAGACDGRGLDQHPCPLREENFVDGRKIR